MAQDGLFFRAVGRSIRARTCRWSRSRCKESSRSLIALSGGYEQSSTMSCQPCILLAACSRSRSSCCARATAIRIARGRRFRAPWHPLSTIVYLIASWGVAIAAGVSQSARRARRAWRSSRARFPPTRSGRDAAYAAGTWPDAAARTSNVRAMRRIVTAHSAWRARVRTTARRCWSVTAPERLARETVRGAAVDDVALSRDASRRAGRGAGLAR